MNSGIRHHIVAFGPFEMDLTERLLLRDRKPVAIAPKLFDTLSVLVENAGHVVEKEELISRLWADTFVEESSLSQNIFQLRKILMKNGPGGGYIETIPKRGYRFATDVVANTETNGGGRPQDEARADIRTIAVMPFAALAGADPDDRYFGIGMADAIIVRLGRLSEVTVMPTRTMLKYVGRLDDLQSVSREHGVQAVLDGGVQRRGERVRVTVQLIDVTDGKCVWSAKFDESTGDVFALQDLISERVANALALEFTPSGQDVERRRDTENVDAFQAYLMGVYFSNKRTPEALSRSVEYFREAIERDPHFARAHAGLADAYFWIAYGEQDDEFRRESFERSREHARAAIDIDPSVAEAHAALGTVQVKHDRDTTAAEASFRRAIEADPASAMAYSRFTYFLAAVGRVDEALMMSSRGQKLDPLSPDANATLAMVLYFLRRYDDAIRYCRNALALEPTFSEAALLTGRCFEQKGMFDDAEEQYALARRLEPGCSEADELRAHLHAIMGRTKLAQKELMQLSASNCAKPYNIAAIYSALGDKERASAWLSRPFINWTDRLRMLRYDPRLDGCRMRIEVR